MEKSDQIKNYCPHLNATEYRKVELWVASKVVRSKLLYCPDCDEFVKINPLKRMFRQKATWAYKIWEYFHYVRQFNKVIRFIDYRLTVLFNRKLAKELNDIMQKSDSEYDKEIS